MSIRGSGQADEYANINKSRATLIPLMFYTIIDLQAFFGNLIPGDFTIFGANVALQSVAQSVVVADSKDFVGEFVFVPEVIFQAGPDDFGDTGLLGKNEGIAMMGGFECGESERFGNGAHDENVGNGIDVAEFLATNEARENDVSTNAEISGQLYEVVFLLAVACEEEDKFGVTFDGKCCSMHEVVKAFLDGETAYGGYDVVAGVFEAPQIIIGVCIEMVV